MAFSSSNVVAFRVRKERESRVCANNSDLADDGDGNRRNWARILIFGGLPVVMLAVVIGGPLAILLT